MTREEAKEVLIIKAGYGDFVENIIDQIYDDHEVQQYLIQSKNYDAIIKAKDDEIELLKFIVEESIKKPMGVEPHSWSDYKMLKDNTCTS